MEDDKARIITIDVGTMRYAKKETHRPAYYAKNLTEGITPYAEDAQ